MPVDFRDFVNEVTARASIVRIVSDYVRLKKQGSRYFGLCPFHEEKTPSFNVNPDKNLYYCFGCGAGGNVFNFIQEIESLDFIDAVKEIASRSGIPIPSFRREQQREPRTEEFIFEINEAAAAYFYQNLLNNPEAYQYLRDRGISEETIRKYRLGYSRDTWDDLLKHVQKQNCDDVLIKRCGLFVTTKNGKLIDMFRGRVMFPILDVQGRITGFGGRLLQEGNVKYLNTSETAVFHKSRNLFGIYHAVKSIRSQNYAILVEGYFDQIMVFQVGFENVVAPLGTAFNRASTGVLKRYTNKVIVAFDSDDAGRKAALRTLEPLLANGFEVLFLDFPDGMDPDDFIRKYGEEDFEREIKSAKTMFDYLFEHFTEGEDLENPKRKVEIIDKALEYFAFIPDRAEKDLYIRKLAEALDVSTEAVLHKSNRVSYSAPRLDERRRGIEESQLPPLDEQKLIQISIDRDLFFMKQVMELLDGKYVNEFTEEVLRRIIELKDKAGYVNSAAVTEALDSDEHKRMLSRLLIEDYVYHDTPKREMYECIKSINKRNLKRKRDVLKKELEKAEKNGVESDVENILKKIQELACQIEKLS